MLRKLSSLLFIAVLFGVGQSIAMPHYDDTNSHLRVSLITCGPGSDEVYSVFGHTGIRVIDSVAKSDLVYNYGTFEFGPDFEIQFMRGKLLYCVSVYPFRDFLMEYVEAKRWVNEQVLDLDNGSKADFVNFLNWNAEPAHKYYKYDFFFNNCSTQIRDILAVKAGKDFKFGSVQPAGQKISFRDIINQYFYSRPWERLGVNVLLGSSIDKIMTDKDIMFLPDFLSTGLKGAKIGDKLVAAPLTTVLKGETPPAPKWNLPFFLMLFICMLTFLGLYIPKLRLLGKVMHVTLMLVSGLLGVLVLVMWLGTDHQACRENLNILWALPTNLIFAFMKGKRRVRYAAIAMVLVLVDLLLHFFGIQKMLLLEMAPFLLSLLMVYGFVLLNAAKPLPASKA